MELVVAPIAELRSRLTHFFEDAVAHGFERADQPVGAGDMFTCGLSGGSSALIFLGALRDAAVDWSRITLFWGDERAVPPESPDSNFGLAEHLLLKPLGGRAPRAVRMPADEADLVAAARDYARQLPETMDLLILGVGEDGHVCSLFPGHPALQSSDHRVTVVDDAPKAPPRRLTLTLPYLLQARDVWIVCVGERKRPLIEQAMRGEPARSPFDLLLAQARAVTLFTDQRIRR